MTTPLPTHPIAFLIASPRSGTTWIQTALNAHPDISCIEQRLFGMHADLVHDEGSHQARLRVTLDRYIDALSLHIAPPIKQPRTVDGKSQLLLDTAATIANRIRSWTGASILIDKITPYLGTSELIVQQVTSLFPEAPLSHLIRDGRDVAVSGVMHWLTKSIEGDTRHPDLARRIRWLVDGLDEDQMDHFFLPGEIESWARTWREPTDALRRLIESDRVCVVRYETMLDDPAAEIGALATHHGADISHVIMKECIRASSFNHMSGGRTQGEDRPGEHVRKGVAGDWKRFFTRTDGQLFHDIAGEILELLDYEHDKSWWKALPETLTKHPPHAPSATGARA